MTFYGLSLIDIRPNATVLISHNRALTYGGVASMLMKTMTIHY